MTMREVNWRLNRINNRLSSRLKFEASIHDKEIKDNNRSKIQVKLTPEQEAAIIKESEKTIQRKLHGRR